MTSQPPTLLSHPDNVKTQPPPSHPHSQQSPAYISSKPTKTSLLSLPTECLQLILAYHRSDLILLHSLLLVSRHFFQLTVPLLYQSPFLLIKTSACDRLPVERSRRQVKLLWVLLSCVRHLKWVMHELPPFAEEFPVLWNPSLKESEIMELLGGGSSRSEKKRDQQTMDSGMRRDQDKLKNKSGKATSVQFLTIDYLNYYTHQNHRTISDSLPTLFPSLICYHMDQWSSSADMIRIRATVERALLMHRPEGIVSLAVPITRVKAIQEAIAATTASGGGKGGLSRLKRIEFYEIRQEFSLEDVLSFLGSLRRPSSPSSSLSSDVAVDARTGTMLLKEIKIGGPSDYGQIGKRSLYTILQALGPCLQTIDLTDWRGAVMDLDQIPTDQVEVLHLRLDRMVADSCDIGQFLKRSRKLKDLQICIGPGHRGLFQWAVEKKRREIRLLSHSRVHDREQQDKKVLNEFICEIDKVEKNLDQVIDDGDEDSSDDSTGDNDGDDDEDNEDQEDPLDMQTDSTRIGRLNQATKKEDEEGLQNLSLAGETPSVLWGLLGATSAFYDRLQVMKATSWMHQRHDGSFDVVDGGIQGQITAHGEQHGHESEQEQGGNTSQGGPPPILPRLYWSAMMTRLVHLELKGEIASLSFDMRSLAQCPVLQRLRLDTYVSDINPDLDRIPEMLDSISSTVCELELMGPWFVTDRDLDRMGRGGVLPRLRTLRLSHCRTWRSEITERAVVENREEMVDSPIPTRIQLPDYLQAAMPLQQDISPSEPISSRTRSRTSSQLLSQSPPRKQKKNRKADTPSTKVKMSTTSSSLASGSTSMSASTPKSGPTPSDKYLSPKGLVKAVEQMTDLHFLYIGISKAQKGSKQRSWLPFEAQSDLLSSEGAVVFREAEKAKEDKQDMELYLDEKSLMEAFKGSVGEVRAFPLEVEIMECI